MEEGQKNEKKPEFNGNLGFIWLVGILVILLGCTVVYTLKITKENTELKEEQQAQLLQPAVETQEQVKTEDKEEEKTRDLTENEKKEINNKTSNSNFYASIFSLQSNYFEEIKKFNVNLLQSNYNKYQFACNMIELDKIKDKIAEEDKKNEIAPTAYYISYSEMKNQWNKLYGENIDLDSLIKELSSSFSIKLKKTKNNKNYIFVTEIDGLGGQNYKLEPVKITESSSNVNTIHFDVLELDETNYKETGKKLGTADIKYNSLNDTIKSIIFHKESNAKNNNYKEFIGEWHGELGPDGGVTITIKEKNGKLDIKWVKNEFNLDPAENWKVKSYNIKNDKLNIELVKNKYYPENKFIIYKKNNKMYLTIENAKGNDFFPEELEKAK